MKKLQSTQYGLSIDRSLFDRTNAKTIPQDEPVFILRAQDIHAADTISLYIQKCYNEKQLESARQCLADFEKFKLDHPERMKEPDK